MIIVIYIYDGLTMLDAIGPYEVLRNLPDIEVKFVAKKKGKSQLIPNLSISMHDFPLMRYQRLTSWLSQAPQLHF